MCFSNDTGVKIRGRAFPIEKYWVTFLCIWLSFRVIAKKGFVFIYRQLFYKKHKLYSEKKCEPTFRGLSAYNFKTVRTSFGQKCQVQWPIVTTLIRGRPTASMKGKLFIGRTCFKIAIPNYRSFSRSRSATELSQKSNSQWCTQPWNSSAWPTSYSTQYISFLAFLERCVSIL